MTIRIGRALVHLVAAWTIVLLSVCSSFADTPTLRDINAINGFDHAIEQLTSALRRVPPEVKNTASIPDIEETWSIAADSTFNASALASAIESGFEGKLTPAQFEDLYVFFNSPLGRHITELEMKSQSADDEEKRAEGERILLELKEGEPERYRLNEKIIVNLAMLETGEAMFMNINRAVIEGGFAVANPSMTPPEEMISKLLQAERPKMRERLKQSVYTGVAYTYRQLTLGELERYCEFLETEASRRYYDEMLFAMDRSLSEAAREFGRRLAETLRQRKA